MAADYTLSSRAYEVTFLEIAGPQEGTGPKAFIVYRFEILDGSSGQPWGSNKQCRACPRVRVVGPLIRILRYNFGTLEERESRWFSL